MNWKGLAKTVRNLAVKNSPAILTGLGVFGFGSAIVMTAKASPAATDIHRKGKGDREYILDNVEREDERKGMLLESYKNEAKQLAPLYGPVILVGIASAGCVISANKIHLDRQAALMTAYSLSTETMARYQGKVIEKLGEDVENALMDGTMKEMADAHPEEGYSYSSDVIPAGTVRVYDNVTGRYFYCSRERILEAESDVNKRLPKEGTVTLQDFYYAMGQEERFNFGETHGWDVSDFRDWNNALDIFFAPHLDDEKNPCLAINYHVKTLVRDI